MRHLLALLFLFASTSFAQQVDFDADQKGFSTIERSGKLVSIRLKPHAKGLELFLMGKDASQIKSLKDWNIEATNEEGENPKLLNVVKTENSFVIEQPKEKRTPLHLKVRSAKKETEVFNVDLTPK